MHIKIFTIPISDNGGAQAEMNRFLQAQKVLKIEQQFYAPPTGACWCFCVSYLPAAMGGGSAFQPAKKVDYKAVLGEAEFRRFSLLRELRKELATADAVPAYAVFTDAELAEMAKAENLDAATVMKIDGIAEKRFEKYGKVMIEKYAARQDQA